MPLSFGGNMETALTIMPIMDTKTAVMRRQAIVDFVSTIMVKDRDFGKVPGTDKDVLLKPGAEKLASFFGLSPRFDIAEKVTDWTGEQHGNEPFFYFQYQCSLYHGDILAGQGVGSCNSWEKKYRYRKAERICPECGKDAIKKSKYPPRNNPGAKPGWYCFAKAGGCGAEFPAGSPEIEQQEAGLVKNDNPADIVNTIDKMAQKRALIAATLIAVNASEFFTQDLEDYTDIIEGDYEDVQPKPRQPVAQPKPPQPQPNGNGHKPASTINTDESEKWAVLAPDLDALAEVIYQMDQATACVFKKGIGGVKAIIQKIAPNAVIPEQNRLVFLAVAKYMQAMADGAGWQSASEMASLWFGEMSKEID